MFASILEAKTEVHHRICTRVEDKKRLLSLKEFLQLWGARPDLPDTLPLADVFPLFRGCKLKGHKFMLTTYRVRQFDGRIYKFLVCDKVDNFHRGSLSNEGYFR